MNLRSQKAAQHSVHPTGGTRRVFKRFAWLGVGSGKMAFSRLAHPRVTLTVGRLVRVAIHTGYLSYEIGFSL